jgi:uncharacterized protein YecT (DUF1311 family)
LTKGLLFSILRPDVFDSEKKKNNDEKRRKMTGKNSKEESTRANVQIQDQKTNKAIQDALQHIQDSDKSSSAVRDLVDETVSVEGK